MPTKIYEDYAGANPEYDEDMTICDECGNAMECGETYIINAHNEYICGDCIEKLEKVDDLVEALGFGNVFDLIGALQKSHHA